MQTCNYHSTKYPHQAIGDLRPDSRDLRNRIDLRDWYRAETGRGRRSGKALVDHAPWREDRKPSLNVYPDGWIDRATGETGDVFSLAQRLHNFSTFRQALDYVAAQIGVDQPARLPISFVNQHSISPNEPPPAAWQSGARQTVEQCHKYLRSDRPDARQARQWLYDRKITNQEIDKYQIGFNPAWAKTGCYTVDENGATRNARLAPGIVIPWIAGEVIWAVKVRCIIGSLADALHRPPETLRGDESPKYLNLAGGNQNGAVFNADRLASNRPAVIVEGEFDAILGQAQLGDQATVITLGSASSDLPRRWREQLEQAPVILLALDTDEAGQKAQARLAEQLGDQARPVHYPAGKDLTEFVVDHGGDVKAWIDTILNTPPDPIWRSIPNGWRRALGKYLPDPVAPMVERLAETGLLVAGQVFSRRQALDLGLTKATVDGGLAGGEGVFWVRDQSFAHIDSDQRDQEDSVNSCRQNSDKVVWFRVLHLPAIRLNLLKRAACRIWEMRNPIGRDVSLPLPRPGYFEAIGFTSAESEALAAELTESLGAVYQRQPDTPRSVKRVKSELDRLKFALVDSHSTPLPVGWTYRNVSEYRAALARAYKVASPALDFTGREWAQMLGISSRAVADVLKRAGIASEQQYVEKPISAADEVDRLCGEVKGFPLHIVSAAPGQRTREYRYDLARLNQELTRAGQVIVKFQVANKQTIVTEGKPAPGVKNPKPSDGVPTPKPKVAISEPAPKPPQPYFGPGYNPAYVRAWLVQACALAKGYQMDSDSRLIDLATGEIILSGATDRQLVDVLRGHVAAHAQAEEDDLLAWIVTELDGEIISIVSTREAA